MCLAVPGRVVDVETDAQSALVDFRGVQRRVRLELVDEPVKPGDYVLVHVGFAIRRIPEEEAVETLALYDLLSQVAGERPGRTSPDIRRASPAVQGNDP